MHSRCPCCCLGFDTVEGEQYPTLRVNGRLETFCDEDHYKAYTKDMANHTAKR